MTTTTSVMGGIVRRKEDPALIQGEGRYVDDIRLPGELHAAFVRSPYARARIGAIDASEALGMDGVRAVYTIEDVRDLGPLTRPRDIGADKRLALLEVVDELHHTMTTEGSS